MPSKIFLFLSVLTMFVIISNPVIAFQTTNMIIIPAGEFQMGDIFNELSSNCLPVHTVYLNAYYIDKYEVTNQQYCNYLNANSGNLYISSTSVMDTMQMTEYYDLDYFSSYRKINWDGIQFSVAAGFENKPVNMVTWYGAKAYTEYYGKRLPTEAEWEKAARGGLYGKRYAWGNELDSPSANCNNYVGELTDVGSYPANGYGLFDVIGNVEEWCNDWFLDNYYSSSPYSSPQGPETGAAGKIIRGGEHRTDPNNGIKIAHRCSGNPIGLRQYTGFRCAGSATSSVDDWNEYKER